MTCRILISAAAIGLLALQAALSALPPPVGIAGLQNSGYGVQPSPTSPAGLGEIQTWLSRRFDLEATERLPAVSFAPAVHMAALRHRETRHSGAGLHAAHDKDGIVAVYDDTSRTIYLPDGWTGETEAQLSVLVHEMVHHLQNEMGQKFPCPAEREKLAFEAQEEFLAHYKLDLERAFGIDPLTRLVRTSCFY
jgi:hypothetical protein